MRFGLVFVAVGTIVAAIFGGVASAYWAGGAAEQYLFAGASAITNVLVLMLVFVMVIATLLTLAERKWSALMQDRVGPNRARIGLPFLKDRALAGLPHIATDVLKMLTKEDFRPKDANSWLFSLAPMLAFAPAFALFAVVPAGPAVPVLGHQVALMVANPDFGILYVFAVASLAVYGTALAGWASNNKFALLGGVRASSQMISYEVALGLSLVGVMMAFSTVQLGGPTGMAEAQMKYLWRGSISGFDLGIPAWGIFLQPIGFLLFFAAAFAETKRAPFDVPEGESEIIGYFVEYSGMKFGLFMIAEFVEVVVLSGLLATIFFGGYGLPFGQEWLASRALLKEQPWLLGSILGTAFWLKVVALCYLQLAVRWTFPRFRYDQIQTLGWKILLPLGLVNVFVTGAAVLWDPSLRTLAAIGGLEVAVLLAITMTARESSSEPDHGDHHHSSHTHAHAPSNP